MHFLDYWQDVRERIDAECSRWVPEFFDQAQHAPVHGWLAAGKRLRACLVCLMCEALGGRLEAAIPPAVAIECIQAASLMHDDYVDGDRTRRARPAAWTVEGARRAVLLADVMFATAIRRMVQADPRAGAVLTRAIAEMAHGAYRELHERSALGLALEAGTYDPREYLSVIRDKSASLFRAAAELGALAAGAEAALVAPAREFGSRIGEIYQIADDLTEVAALAAPRSGPASAADRGALAPALLYFSDAAPQAVLALLRKPPRSLGAREHELLRAAASAMRREIGARQESAAAVLDALPGNAHTRLMREMPPAMIHAG